MAKTILAATASRRPRKAERSSEVELAILAATERLLNQHTARDLSVAQILEESAISRATFYHYFSSKWEVVNFLAASVMEQIFEQVQRFTDGGDDVTRREALGASIVDGCRIWAEHRAVLRAVLDHWREVPELRTLLVAVLEPFKKGLAEELDRERAAGVAPTGPESGPLVSALLWSSLSCLHVAGLADLEEIADEDEAATLLTAIWMRTLYAEDVA